MTMEQKNERDDPLSETLKLLGTDTFLHEKILESYNAFEQYIISLKGNGGGYRESLRLYLVNPSKQKLTIYKSTHSRPLIQYLNRFMAIQTQDGSYYQRNNIKPKFKFLKTKKQ